MALHRRRAEAQDEGMRQRLAHETKPLEESSQKMPKAQHFQQRSQRAARSNMSPLEAEQEQPVNHNVAQQRHAEQRRVHAAWHAARPLMELGMLHPMMRSKLHFEQSGHRRESTSRQYPHTVPDPQVGQQQARPARTLTGKQKDTMAGRHTTHRNRPERARDARRNSMNLGQKHGMLQFAALHVHWEPPGAQQDADRCCPGRPDHRAQGGTRWNGHDRWNGRTARTVQKTEHGVRHPSCAPSF